MKKAAITLFGSLATPGLFMSTSIAVQSYESEPTADGPTLNFVNTDMRGGGDATFINNGHANLDLASPTGLIATRAIGQAAWIGRACLDASFLSSPFSPFKASTKGFKV